MKNEETLIKNIDKEIKSYDKMIVGCYCLLSVFISFFTILIFNSNGIF